MGFASPSSPSAAYGMVAFGFVRHCPGPIDFSIEEAKNWGLAVQDASILVKKITQCDRVYTMHLERELSTYIFI